MFGIKVIAGRLAWEFYFYDYARRQREVSISRVLEAIQPFARCCVRPNEGLPYFMFSLDLDADLAAGRRDLDVVHMYIGNPGSTVSSGIAYAVRPGGVTLENFYFFFDAERQLDEAAGKICSSAHFDDLRLPVDAVLVPQLRRCKTIASTSPASTCSSLCISSSAWHTRNRSSHLCGSTLRGSTTCCSTSDSTIEWRQVVSLS